MVPCMPRYCPPHTREQKHPVSFPDTFPEYCLWGWWGWWGGGEEDVDGGRGRGWGSKGFLYPIPSYQIKFSCCTHKKAPERGTFQPVTTLKQWHEGYEMATSDWCLVKILTTTREPPKIATHQALKFRQRTWITPLTGPYTRRGVDFCLI